MARAAGLAREDDAKTKLDKLDALLATSATSREDAALLRRHAVLAERRPLSRARTRPAAAPSEDLGGADRPDRGDLRAKSPVLMIFEDAHWADPSSLEVFGRLVDKIDALRVLLFVTFRPEFAAPWIGRPHVTALTINRLTPREVDGADRAGRRQQAAAGEYPAGHRRARRRHSAVRGGDDEGGAGGRGRGRGGAHGRGGPLAGARGPREPARLADGAARPAGTGQGRGADRRGDRPGVLPCAARASVARLPDAGAGRGA